MPKTAYDAEYLCRLAAAVDVFDNIPDEAHLDTLQVICEGGNGRWDPRINLPHVEQPLLIEIEALGVSAMAEKRDQVVPNWLRAANNILNAEAALNQGDAA